MPRYALYIQTDFDFTVIYNGVSYRDYCLIFDISDVSDLDKFVFIGDKTSEIKECFEKIKINPSNSFDSTGGNRGVKWVVMSEQSTSPSFDKIIKEIKLPAEFSIRLDTHPEGRFYIQIRQESTCNRTGKPYNEGGRKWDLSQHMTESEVVLTAWKAYLTFIEHEAREQFHYKGKKIFDPHIDVNALLEACEKISRRN